MCQPGYPRPQGLSQTRAWFSNLLLVKQSTKSWGLRLFGSTSIRAPVSVLQVQVRQFAVSGNFVMSK
jgi:hypothetical protein